MAEPRPLQLHDPLGRMPHAMLKRMLELVEADTPAHGPGSPVDLLEHRVAELLGKQQALLFPTGTMAQQVALRIHADHTGRPVFAAHPQTHLHLWEHHGYSVVHGLRFQPAGDANELMTADALAAIGEPVGVALWELPQRIIGGLLPEWDDLGAQIALMRARGAATHLDGARLWEAQTYYQRPFAEIADLFDTVYVSLYKALQGVGGALLAGDQGTIAEAKVWRRRLGGDVFEPWAIALAGLSGLDRLLPRMPEFREHAIAIVAAINADGAARVYPDPPQTPLFHVHLPAPPAAINKACAEQAEELGADLVGGWAKTVPDPTRCRFELTVGENAMAFRPEEIVKLIHDLLDRAARH